MPKDKRFELVMTEPEFKQLDYLAGMYNLSRAAVIRLAVTDLYQRIQNTNSRTQSPRNPILQPPTESLPPEVDEFWKVFRS